MEVLTLQKMLEVAAYSGCDRRAWLVGPVRMRSFWV
jgi:hypothetical protein